MIRFERSATRIAFSVGRFGVLCWRRGAVTVAYGRHAAHLVIGDHGTAPSYPKPTAPTSVHAGAW